MGQRGIRVNAVAPGPFWTPLQPSGGQPPEALETFGADTPLGRPGQPAEIAAVYVLLASRESSYATGQVYGAAGGQAGPTSSAVLAAWPAATGSVGLLAMVQNAA